VGDSIEDLKRDFEAAEDLAALMHRFFDCIDADPRLTSAAQPGEAPPAMVACVDRIGREVLGRGASLTSARWLHLGRHRLWHGGGVLGGKLVTVVWFEDLQRGLLALSLDLRGRMHFARFTLAGASTPQAAARN
jgi:hypothetical protein